MLGEVDLNKNLSKKEYKDLHKQIIKYKYLIKQINKNNSIKTQKCIDKYPQRCYYKTIKNNKRKTKKKIIQFIA